MYFPWFLSPWVELRFFILDLDQCGHGLHVVVHLVAASLFKLSYSYFGLSYKTCSWGGGGGGSDPVIIMVWAYELQYVRVREWVPSSRKASRGGDRMAGASTASPLCFLSVSKFSTGFQQAWMPRLALASREHGDTRSPGVWSAACGGCHGVRDRGPSCCAVLSPVRDIILRWFTKPLIEGSQDQAVQDVPAEQVQPVASPPPVDSWLGGIVYPPYARRTMSVDERLDQARQSTDENITRSHKRHRAWDQTAFSSGSEGSPPPPPPPSDTEVLRKELRDVKAAAKYASDPIKA